MNAPGPGTAYHSMLKDFMDERRLLSVLSFMRKERLSIIQREITGMRERLHDRGPRIQDGFSRDR